MRGAIPGATIGRRFFGVAGRRRTYLHLAYLLTAFPLGFGYFLLIVIGGSLGIGLAIIGIGLVILVTTFALSLVLAGVERRLNNALVGTELRSRDALDGDGVAARIGSLIGDRYTWTAIVYLPCKFVYGLVGFVLVFTGLTTGIGMLTVPLYYDRPGVYVGIVSDRAPEIHETIHLGWNYMLVSLETAFTLGHWMVDGPAGAALTAVAGLGLLVLTLHVSTWLTRGWGRFAMLCLDGGYDPLGAASTAIRG